jgi:hypothetical protein
MRAVAKLAKAEASVGVIDAPEPEAGSWRSADPRFRRRYLWHRYGDL